MADAGCSFETSVNFYRTLRCYIVDVGNRRGKKSRSRITFFCNEIDVFGNDPVLPATGFCFRECRWGYWRDAIKLFTPLSPVKRNIYIYLAYNCTLTSSREPYESIGRPRYKWE